MHLYSAEQSPGPGRLFFLRESWAPVASCFGCTVVERCRATCLGGFPVSAKLHSSPRKRARVTMGSSAGDSYLLLLSADPIPHSP